LVWEAAIGRVPCLHKIGRGYPKTTHSLSPGGVRIVDMGAGLVVTMLSLIGTILVGVAFWRLFAR
jgi:hypothetical protein